MSAREIASAAHRAIGRLPDHQTQMAMGQVFELIAKTIAKLEQEVAELKQGQPPTS